MAVGTNLHEHAGHAHHGDPHGHSHAHAHGLDHGATARALAWALAITTAFMVVEVVGGFLSHSLALLADAAHMLLDVGALGLSLFAAWIAGKPASRGRTYGYVRVEILAALVNGALLLAVTAGIVWEALQRLMHPEPVLPGIMFWVAAAGFAANVASAMVLHSSRGESLNMRGAYLHVLSDLFGSFAAMAAALIIRFTGWTPADPALSILLSVLLVVSGWRLLWQAVLVLLEAAPAHVDMNALEAAVAAVPDVERVHDMHVWTVSSGFVAMSAHAVVRDATRSQGALAEITRRVRDFGISHVTVQLEQGGDCAGCDPK
ncbi:MAG: cation diffusion facilitator family transporter [Gemmatimonadales bacterium]